MTHYVHGVRPRIGLVNFLHYLTTPYMASIASGLHISLLALEIAPPNENMSLAQPMLPVDGAFLLEQNLCIQQGLRSYDHIIGRRRMLVSTVRKICYRGSLRLIR